MLDLLFLRNFNHGWKENELKYKRMAGWVHAWGEAHEGGGRWPKNTLSIPVSPGITQTTKEMF